MRKQGVATLPDLPSYSPVSEKKPMSLNSTFPQSSAYSRNSFTASALGASALAASAWAGAAAAAAGLGAAVLAAAGLAGSAAQSVLPSASTPSRAGNEKAAILANIMKLLERPR